MSPLYLQNLLVDFRQTFVSGASWDKDELIGFGVKYERSNVKVTFSWQRHPALD